MIDWELFMFLLLSAIEIISSILVVTNKRLLRASFWLIITLATIAGIYILLRAEFVALVQILVYAGAVPVLFLFGVMLTKKKILEEVETPETK